MCFVCGLLPENTYMKVFLSALLACFPFSIHSFVNIKSQDESIVIGSVNYKLQCATWLWNKHQQFPLWNRKFSFFFLQKKVSSTNGKPLVNISFASHPSSLSLSHFLKMCACISVDIISILSIFITFLYYIFHATAIHIVSIEFFERLEHHRWPINCRN